MTPSLPALVAQIQNKLSGGLRGQSNFTYSLDEIADHIAQVRTEVVNYRATQKDPVPLRELTQRLRSVRIAPQDWLAAKPGTTDILSRLPVPLQRLRWHYCRLPRLMATDELPVSYFGPAGEPENWTVVREVNGIEHEGHRRVGRQKPLVVWLGEDCWITGRDGRLPEFLDITAAFADPRHPAEMGLSDEWHLTVEHEDGALRPAYPMPADVWETVRRRIFPEFDASHGRTPPQPNTGTALV